jgi:phosphate transport system substrate-binding protein
MNKLVILAACAVLSTSVNAHAETNTYKIGVLVWRDTQDHVDGLAGFVSGMEATGLHYTLDIEKAHENEPVIKNILKKWNEERPDLILTFGTKGARWAVAETKGIPIVAIGMVADPVKYGIAESLERPGKGVTGTLNIIQAQDKLNTFAKCIPNLKRLGVIYDCCDIIAASEVQGVREACEKVGITMKEADVKDVNGIGAAVTKLVNEGIDVLWVPTETFIYQNMPVVTKVTHPSKLPVVSSTASGTGGEEGNKDAAIMAVTLDLKEIGKLSVPSVVEILTAGKDPGELPMRTVPSYEIIVNKNAAREIGFQIPPALLAQANTILRGFGGQKITIAGTGDCQEFLRTAAHRLVERLGEGEIVVPESVGSTGGIKALLKGDADLARIARPLKKSEEAQGLTYISLGAAPVVFVVHESVSGLENITSEQVVDIYSGKITNWRVLGGQDGKIYPVMREPGDSSLSVIQSCMPQMANLDKPAALTCYTSPQAFEAIASHKGTIGFLATPMVANSSLKVLKLDGVYPSEANLLNGTYKLKVPIGLVYKGELKGLAKSMVDFVMSEEGSSIAAKFGIIETARQPD